MEIYFLSRVTNEKIVFDGKIYGISDMDLFKHEFSYISENDRITEFKKGIFAYEVSINISDGNGKSWEENYYHMQNVFERDTMQNIRGELHVNGYYLLCNVYAGSVEDPFRNWCDFQEIKIRIVTDYQAWIKEGVNHFYSFETSSCQNKKYPGKYPYRYANGGNSSFIINEHFYESDFRMIIYGPVVNPQVTIGGYTYLTNIVLEDGEYLQIESRTETIRKYFVNGTSVNAFHNRKKGGKFFRRIPPGRHTIIWTGKFNFDLILHEERSEPKW